MPLPIEELFTPEHLKAWLKTKPADEKYEYNDADVCPLTQFLHDNGYPKARVGAFSIYMGGWDEVDKKMRLPLGFNDVARGRFFGKQDNTFGEMLRRAEEQWPVVG